VKTANAVYPISYEVITDVHKINSNTYDKAYPKMTKSFNAISH